jgi:hypothetical protein
LNIEVDSGSKDESSDGDDDVLNDNPQIKVPSIRLNNQPIVYVWLHARSQIMRQHHSSMKHDLEAPHAEHYIAVYEIQSLQAKFATLYGDLAQAKVVEANVTVVTLQLVKKHLELE